MKKSTAVFGLMVILAACSGQQAPPPAPANHALMPKIALDVQTISLADRSGAQMSGSPYNANHFSPTISEAIKQWAADRLQAAGRDGQTLVIIKEASLISQPLPVKTGFDSWFTRQQAVKYIGRAEVTIESRGLKGFATTNATATRSVTLPEDPTDIERQDAYYDLLNGLMKDLGQNLDSGLQEHMGAFIINAPTYGTTAFPMMQETSPTTSQAPMMMPDSMMPMPLSGR